MQAVDTIQLKITKQHDELDNIQQRIRQEYMSKITHEEEDMLKNNQSTPEDAAMIIELKGIGQLLQDSLILKRFNTVGCKMKIY